MSEMRDLLCISMVAGDCVMLGWTLPAPIQALVSCVQLHRVIRLRLSESRVADRHVYLFPARVSSLDDNE